MKNYIVNTGFVMKRALSLALSLIMAVTVIAGVDFTASAEETLVPPTDLCASAISKTTIELQWYEGDYADYYELDMYDFSTKSYTTVAEFPNSYSIYPERTYKLKNLTPNTKYGFAVRSYNIIDDQKSYSKYSKRVDVYTAPDETKLTGVKYNSAGKITVKWNKIAGVSGYLIEYSTDKNFDVEGPTSVVQVTNGNTTSKTISGLAKKKYYVRVTSYQKGGDHCYCSDYSNVKSVSVKEGVSVKSMLNSIKTTTDGKKDIKNLTNNGVDISKYDTTYDRFKAIYNWHAKHFKDNGWDCMGCNINFNSCIYALFKNSSRGYDSFIYLAAGDVKNGDGSTAMHKWPMIYLAGVPYIFDPRLQGYTGNYTGTDYFGLSPSSSKTKMFLFDYKMLVWPGGYFPPYNDYFTFCVPRPSNVSVTSISARPSGFRIKWKKVSDATGYQIKYSTTSDFKSSKTVNVNSSTLAKTISGLGSEKKYYVKIRAYRKKDGETSYGFWSSAKQIKTRNKNEAGPASISKLTAVSKGFKAQWDEVSNATGYELSYSTSPDFTSKKTKTVKLKGAAKKSKTVSKLTANKKYYVRIRTYRVVNGKTYYSEWSSAKNIKTKK